MKLVLDFFGELTLLAAVFETILPKHRGLVDDRPHGITDRDAVEAQEAAENQCFSEPI
jgi:hypothetical protein